MQVECWERQEFYFHELSQLCKVWTMPLGSGNISNLHQATELLGPGEEEFQFL